VRILKEASTLTKIRNFNFLFLFAAIVDENQEKIIEDKGLKALEELQGLMTRARAKRIKRDLEKMVVALFKSEINLDLEEPMMINCIHLENMGSNEFN